MPHLETFGFEAFPAEVRLKIYRELLVDEYGQELDPPKNCGYSGPGLHPHILACNQRIHDEAAAVLYGENRFTFGFSSYPIKLWHIDGSDKTVLPRHYSCLVTSIRTGANFNTSWQEGYDHTNMEDVCKKLSLNDLKWLEVHYVNVYNDGPHQTALWDYFPGEPYEGENCLRPLMKVRATRFKINDHVSPAFAARLKAKIQGPKDAVFLAGRQRQMEEPESDLDTREEDEEDD